VRLLQGAVLLQAVPRQAWGAVVVVAVGAVVRLLLFPEAPPQLFLLLAPVVAVLCLLSPNLRSKNYSPLRSASATDPVDYPCWLAV